MKASFAWTKPNLIKERTPFINNIHNVEWANVCVLELDQAVKWMTAFVYE